MSDAPNEHIDSISALYSSETQLQLATLVAKLAVAEVDYTNNTIYLSPEAATIFGLATEAISVPRATVHALFHPDDAPEIFRLINEVASQDTKDEFAVEHRIIRPDGKVRWLNVRKKFFGKNAVDSSTPTKALLVIADITKRKIAEEALRQSEERYRYLFENMGDGFCIVELVYDENQKPIDYRFIEANPAFERHTGLVQAVGKTARALVPNLEQHWVDHYDRVATTGTPSSFEEGSEAMGRWFTVNTFRVGDAESRRVAIFFKDISERKQVEWQLKDSEQRLRNILDNLFAFVGITTPDGTLIEANHTALSAADLEPEEVLGKHFADTYWWSFSESTQAQLRESIQQAAQGKPARYDVEIRLRDDLFIIIDFMLGFVRNEDGEITHLVPSGVDITDRKKTEAKLQELTDTLERRVTTRTAELEQSLRELDQFAYVASHDLKAPLRAIDHLASWIAEDAETLLPDASKEHLQKLRSRVQRMETLLEDLLAYSRAGRIRGDAVSTRLEELVDNVIELVNPPNKFTISRTSQMPVIVTYKAPLELIIRNLIDNAIKHHHKETGIIRIEAFEDGDFVKISVRDDGAGIDPKYHKQIFEMFSTLVPRDEVEGSGIGLAIVKKTVESLNGQIWVQSALNEGTTFTFTWPKDISAVEITSK